MSPNYDNLLDDIGLQILEILQEDASLSYKEIGGRIGLSGAAVGERIKKMLEVGIIRAIRAEINFEMLDLPTTAFIRIDVVGVNSLKLKDKLKRMPEIIEFHELVGRETILLKVVLPSVAALQDIREMLSHYGDIRASIVMSSSHFKKSLRDRENPPEFSLWATLENKAKPHFYFTF